MRRPFPSSTMWCTLAVCTHLRESLYFMVPVMAERAFFSISVIIMVSKGHRRQTLGGKLSLTFGATRSKLQNCEWDASMLICVYTLTAAAKTFLSLHSTICVFMCAQGRSSLYDTYIPLNTAEHLTFNQSFALLSVWKDAALTSFSLSPWSFLQVLLFDALPSRLRKRGDEWLWIMEQLSRVLRTGQYIRAVFSPLSLSLWFPGWGVVLAWVPEGEQESPWESEIWLGLENLPGETAQAEVGRAFHWVW